MGEDGDVKKNMLLLLFQRGRLRRRNSKWGRLSHCSVRRSCTKTRQARKLQHGSNAELTSGARVYSQLEAPDCHGFTIEGLMHLSLIQMRQREQRLDQVGYSAFGFDRVSTKDETGFCMSRTCMGLVTKFFLHGKKQ